MKKQSSKKAQKPQPKVAKKAPAAQADASLGQRVAFAISLLAPNLGYEAGQISPERCDAFQPEDGAGLSEALDLCREGASLAEIIVAAAQVVDLEALEAVCDFASVEVVLMRWWEAWSWSAQVRLLTDASPSQAFAVIAGASSSPWERCLCPSCRDGESERDKWSAAASDKSLN